MSDTDQEKSLATISGLAEAIRRHDLSSIQLDQLQIAEHLLTNIAVQLTVAASERANAEAMATPEPVMPKVDTYVGGEPVNVLILASRVEHEHWEKATITGVEMRPCVPGGLVYKTNKTGKHWLTAGRLSKVRK